MNFLWWKNMISNREKTIYAATRYIPNGWLNMLNKTHISERKINVILPESYPFFKKYKERTLKNNINLCTIDIYINMFQKGVKTKKARGNINTLKNILPLSAENSLCKTTPHKARETKLKMAMRI